MPVHSDYCDIQYRDRCNCGMFGRAKNPVRIVENRIIARIKQIESERDSLYSLIGMCVMRGEDYSTHQTAALTCDARIEELRAVLKDLDTTS